MEAKVFEQIFGVYSIRQRKFDGYLSATDMCKANGKEFGVYRQNKSTDAYAEALESDLGIPKSNLIEIHRGGISQEQGSWVHPQVALHLAQWLSPTFAVQVNKWVSRYLNGDITLVKDIVDRHEEVTGNKVINIEFTAVKEQLDIDERRMILHQKGMELEKEAMLLVKQRADLITYLDTIKHDPQAWQVLRDDVINHSMASYGKNLLTAGNDQPNILDNRDITALFHTAIGRKPTLGERSILGKVIKKAYIAKYNKEPLKGPKNVNSAARNVYLYPATDSEWIIDIIKEWNAKPKAP